MGAKARPFSLDDERTIWEPNSGCLIWLGAVNTAGYGILKIGGVCKRAHQTSFEMHNCARFPGLFICHTCDNKLCVNPGHLYQADRQTNVNDAVARNRLRPRRGHNNGMSKLTDEKAIAILNSPLSQSVLARQYGVSQPSISYIKRGCRKSAA